MKNTYHPPLTHAELDTLLKKKTRGQMFTSPNALMRELTKEGHRLFVGCEKDTEKIMCLNRKHMACALRRAGFKKYSSGSWVRVVGKASPI